jgi:transposase
MAIVTLGIDLAKNVFALHGVDAAGKAVLVRPNVLRGKLLEVVAALPPCLIGMEACSGAHHWARLFQAHGHTVRLMAPKFAAPHRLSGKKGKKDAADAAAICEAITRPSMRFVPPKSLQQQSELLVHRARQGFVQQRTATINHIRGLLSEFGIVLPLKAATVRREAMHQLEDLPGWANTVVGDLLSEVHRLDQRIAQYDGHIAFTHINACTSRGGIAPALRHAGNLKLSPRFRTAQHMRAFVAAIATRISSMRRYGSPALVIRPSRCLPPELY